KFVSICSKQKVAVYVPLFRIARNYFDSIFYNDGRYVQSWTLDSAVLFTATTLVPVGFGLVTPLTWCGRLFLIIYAIFGIPLALITISDMGKFFCTSVFKFFRESTVTFMATLVILLFLYPFVGGVCIHYVSHLSLFDSIYYCCITILTVGYGDIEPPISIPYLILFIFVGVTLVTISVDVVATSIIHQVHYMGRRMGDAKLIADKMMQMAQKISINKGLGLGMTQLGAFARMGIMINLTSNGKKISHQEKSEELRINTAYNPDFDFDLIDQISELENLKFQHYY
ncbi:Ion channel, partial [Trichostrongylus colubriformis]